MQSLMDTRKLRTSLLFALVAMEPVAAQAATEYVWIGGEAGWVERPSQVRDQAQLTREGKLAQDEAIAKYQAAQMVGWGNFGASIGWAQLGQAYAVNNGQWECVDGIAHNTKVPVKAGPNTIYGG